MCARDGVSDLAQRSEGLPTPFEAARHDLNLMGRSVPLAQERCSGLESSLPFKPVAGTGGALIRQHSEASKGRL